VLAWAVTDRRTGGRVLFAPVFGAIDANLRHAILAADVAFLDGSFFSDDELPSLELVDKRARSLGHQPVGGEDGTLADVATIRNRRVFVHLNNSNPMLDLETVAARDVSEAGAEVGYDGMEFTL
jgi:pyrroloquinoline quinone biosynthesis protein B